MQESPPVEGAHPTIRQRLGQFFSSPWFWGVVAVVTTIIATSYVALYFFALVCACIAIHQARFFEHAKSTAWRRAGTGSLFVIAGLLLAIIWSGFRPKPQVPAATREDVHNEVNDAMKRFIPPATPQQTPIPTLTPEPTVSPIRKIRNKRRLNPEQERLLRDLNNNRQYAHPQSQQGSNRIISRQGLEKALSRRLTKAGLNFLIQQVQERGVEFRLSSEDEQHLRVFAAKAGNKNLDDLINAIRFNYRTGRDRPDLSLRLVHPHGFAVVLVNDSDVVLREPKYIPAMWDLDREHWDEPLPIPVDSGDWIRAHESLGPNAFITQDRIAPLVKKGDRLVGMIGVTCPTCVRRKDYWVYAVHGEGGWFAQLPEGRYVDLAALTKAIPKIRANVQLFFALAPVENRIAIETP